jgi:hypothetical protein
MVTPGILALPDERLQRPPLARASGSVAWQPRVAPGCGPRPARRWSTAFAVAGVAAPARPLLRPVVPASHMTGPTHAINAMDRLLTLSEERLQAEIRLLQQS